MKVENALLIPKKDKIVLTSREAEYLSLAALGCKNWMIANSLLVTKSTVKKTLENVFKKLHARDRANAVAIAFTHHIISPQVLKAAADKFNLDKTAYTHNL